MMTRTTILRRKDGAVRTRFATLLITAVTAAACVVLPATAAHADAPAILAVDGAPEVVDTTGTVAYRFEGHVGQHLTIGLRVPLADGSTSGYAQRVRVVGPSGTEITRYAGHPPQAPATYALTVPELAEAGPYTVELAPSEPHARIRVTVSVSERHDRGGIEVNGPGRMLDFYRTGQERELTFIGDIGGMATVDVTEFAFTTRQAARSPGMWIEVFRPGSADVAYRGVAFGDSAHEVGPLRVSGTFTIRARPLDDSSGSATIALRHVS
jgi:hypothetical protein